MKPPTHIPVRYGSNSVNVIRAILIGVTASLPSRRRQPLAGFRTAPFRPGVQTETLPLLYLMRRAIIAYLGADRAAQLRNEAAHD